MRSSFFGLMMLLCAGLLEGRPTDEESLKAQMAYFGYGSSLGEEVEELRGLIGDDRWWTMYDALKFTVTLVNHGEEGKPSQVTGAFRSARRDVHVARFEGLLRFYSADDVHLGDHKIAWSGRATPDRTLWHTWDCDVILPSGFTTEFIPTMVTLLSMGSQGLRDRTIMAPAPYVGYVALRDGSRPGDAMGARSSATQPWREQIEAERAAAEAREREASMIAELARAQNEAARMVSVDPATLRSKSEDAKTYEMKWRLEAERLKRDLQVCIETKAKVSFQNPVTKEGPWEFDFRKEQGIAEVHYNRAIADCLRESMEADRVDRETQARIARLQRQMFNIMREPDVIEESDTVATVRPDDRLEGQPGYQVEAQTRTRKWDTRKDERILATMSEIDRENRLRRRYGLPKIR